MQKSEVYNRIAELRATYKVTQEQLAQSLGVSRQTIISIERGKYIPSLRLALKIGKYFNLALEKIFSYEED